MYTVMNVKKKTQTKKPKSTQGNLGFEISGRDFFFLRLSLGALDDGFIWLLLHICPSIHPYGNLSGSQWKDEWKRVGKGKSDLCVTQNLSDI